MKKTIFSLLTLIILLTLTGCSLTSKSNTKGDDFDNDNEQEKNEVVYYCKQIDDDDFEVFWTYENDVLVEITETSIYADNDSYKEAQKNLKDFKGVTVRRENGKLYIDMDIKNGGLSYYETVRYGKNFDTSFENIDKLMKKDGFKCLEIINNW